jgi:hypothetical protein
MPPVKLKSWYYQQFDADFARDVPGEGYGGWKHAELPLSPERTAVVVMHAWDCGTREEYPGWHRAVEYIGRSYEIVRNVFPSLLGAVRSSPLRLYHVVSSASYCRSYPGFKRTLALSGPPGPRPSHVATDPVADELRAFRRDYSFPGKGNIPDIERGSLRMGFPRGAEPQGDEGIAENGEQLYALCHADGINHLVYAGFAINWCLLMSPGGMLEMSRYGLLCSALRQAVTAVENRETARKELNKELGLWRVSVAFGMVYDVDDFVSALSVAKAGS